MSMRFWSPVSIRSSALAEPRSSIADVLDVDLLHPVDRRRQGQADARAERAAVAAEAGDDAALPGRNRRGSEVNDQPQRRRRRGSPTGSSEPVGPAREAAAAAAEARPAAAQEFVERGRRCRGDWPGRALAALGRLAPWAAAAFGRWRLAVRRRRRSVPMVPCCRRTGRERGRPTPNKMLMTPV